MKLLEKARALSFWTIDALRGGKIRRYLNNIKEIEDGLITEQELDAYYKKHLRRLLNHSVHSVPKYANLSELLNEDNPIEKWPIVDKASLKASGENCLSNLFNKKSLIPMSTSGSTGTPFTCWQNSDKKRHVNAEVLFYNGKIGFSIGRKIIYFRSIVNEVKKSQVQQYLQNINLLDCCNLSDEVIKARLEEIKKLSANGGAMILSYASTLDAISRYFLKYGVQEASACNIYGIVSGSEMLKDTTREILSNAFRCKVVSRYANEENGFIGQDDIDNNIFLHNRAHYYIEILKIDQDILVEKGETGRIVITDLFNYSMPIIRYDTGDIGSWTEVCHNGIKRKAIGNFGGRRIDMIFDCNGNLVSPHSITNRMWEFGEIQQYQFIQTQKSEYVLKLNTSHPVDEKRLIKILKEAVGNDSIVHIEYVKEIPVLASGKRKYIVNLTNNQI